MTPVCNFSSNCLYFFLFVGGFQWKHETKQQNKAPKNLEAAETLIFSIMALSHMFKSGSKDHVRERKVLLKENMNKNWKHVNDGNGMGLF